MKVLLALILSINMALAGTVVSLTEGTATTTSTQALAANTGRRSLLIQNRGSQILHVKTASAHTGGQVGVVIAAGGNWEPYETPVDAIFLKSDAATSDYTIAEGK